MILSKFQKGLLGASAGIGVFRDLMSDIVMMTHFRHIHCKTVRRKLVIDVDDSLLEDFDIELEKFSERNFEINSSLFIIFLNFICFYGILAPPSDFLPVLSANFVSLTFPISGNSKFSNNVENTEFVFVCSYPNSEIQTF